MAREALAAVAKRGTSHQVESYSVIEHKHSAGKGRPTPRTPLKALEWQIQAHVRSDDDTIEHHKQVKACFVLGTNIDVSELSDAAVIAAYKGQAHVEGGFRFLNDPLLFVSSWFIKKPSRIEGLLMVMTLALLVDSVAHRRLRQQVAQPPETVPHQLNQPITSPTLRWVCQLLEGLHRVLVTWQGQVPALIEGLNDGPIKLLRVFGAHVCCLYQIAPV